MDDANARRVRAWIDSYIQAWNSNDPADIRALFTQDAAYHTEPYSPPWRGRDEIVRQWLDLRCRALGDEQLGRADADRRDDRVAVDALQRIDALAAPGQSQNRGSDEHGA